MPDVTNILQVFQLYNGSNWFLPLLVPAILYLLWRAGKETRRNMLLMLLAAVILVFNQLIFRLSSHLMGSDTYYRFLWMIPVAPILAYVVVDLCVRQKNRILKGFVLVAACLVLWGGGTSCIDSESFHWPNHIAYLNQDAGQICDLIMADTDVEYPRVAVDESLINSMRLCNNKIINYIERKAYQMTALKQGKSKSIRRQYLARRLVNGKRLSKKYTQAIVSKGVVHYIVIATAYEMDDYMADCGYPVIGRSDSYTVYKCHK
jgi:hypothetical protein